MSDPRDGIYDNGKIYFTAYFLNLEEIKDGYGGSGDDLWFTFVKDQGVKEYLGRSNTRAFTDSLAPSDSGLLIPECLL